MAKNGDDSGSAEAIKKLSYDILRCIHECNTSREFNHLAFLLVTKALDILEAVHGEDFMNPLQYIVHDRSVRMRVPKTEEYAKKQLIMRKFLP